MRLLACLIVAPQRGYDEPAILSYAISSFCPTSADGLHPPLLIRDYVFTGDEQWLVASGDGVIVVIDDLESRVDYLPVFLEPWSTCRKKAALEARKVPLEQPAFLLELPV